MIDNTYHKKIAYHVHETEKNQKRHDPDELVHDEPKSANMYANALKNMTLKKMGGGSVDKVNDTHRVELENAMGAGATTVYKKQLPKYGNGKPNMEMEDERESIIKRGGAKIPPNTFGRIQQSVLTGGSDKEKSDLVDVIINKLMSGKKATNAKELEVDEKLGAGWTDAVKGISAGAKPKKPPMKKDIKLGRGMDEDSQVHGNGGSTDRRKARAECIKRIMQEKGMKMIEASKYIKSNNIKY